MFRHPRFLLIAFALAAVVVLAVLLASTSGRSPTRPPLPNPNGYDDFVKAGGAVLGNVDDFPDLDHASLIALVSTNTEPLRLLRLGLTRQCFMPTASALTYDTGFLPRERMNGLAQLLATEGRLREMENQLAGAAQSYVEAIRYGNEMSRGARFTSRLVGIGCEMTGYTPLAKLVPKFSPDEAGAVLTALDKLDAGRVTWAEVQQSERRLMRYRRGKQFSPISWVEYWVGYWRGTRQVMRAYATSHNIVVARERLLAAELALRCYQSAHGHPAARLDELTTNYLSHVPQDPFSGQPLIYRAQGTNWLFYSVGPNGVDDGGKPIGRGLARKDDLFFDSP
jgi:hypothetical protein